jgi:hypothetical protein
VFLAFVMAQAACFVHCHVGVAEGSAEALPPCHAVPSQDDQGAPDLPASMPSEACVTLKTMVVGADAPTLVPPEFHTLYLLSSHVLSLEDLASEPAGELRQARSFDWIFTPEVSLGPAFRSLAPPLVVLS